MNRVPGRGAWLRVRALSVDGRDALNATVAADIGSVRYYRDVQAAGSYLVANDPGVHFGLGTETRARNVAVRWLGGVWEHFGDFDAGGTVELRQGKGQPPS
jgi:enediyne biosynthesis protein E4